MYFVTLTTHQVNYFLPLLEREWRSIKAKRCYERKHYILMIILIMVARKFRKVFCLVSRFNFLSKNTCSAGRVRNIEQGILSNFDINEYIIYH